jgi:ATP-dependent HslUV protease subunit HslV
MSIAVAVRKRGHIVVAADSQESFGDRRVLRDNHSASKIIRTGSSYIASTGWGVYDNILRDYLARVTRPRLGSERAVFAFFITFWRQLHKRYQFVNDQVADEDDPSPFADLDSSFLVTNRTGIYYVSGNISVMAFKKYYAIGSGASYALGALHALYDQGLGAEALARRACEAAIAFDACSSGDIDVCVCVEAPLAATRARSG